MSEQSPPSSVPLLRIALSLALGWIFTATLALVLFFVWEQADYDRLLNLGELAGSADVRRELSAYVADQRVLRSTCTRRISASAALTVTV